MRRFMLVSLVVLVTAAGCVIVDPSCTSSAASIYVSPAVVVVSVGQSFTPTATERGCDGRRYDHSPPRWSLVNASDSVFVALDASTGEITGRRIGRATVVARSTQSGSESSVSVTVH